jgi:hypothetical protein
MTESCRKEAARGSWGKPGFPHATEPTAREAA